MTVIFRIPSEYVGVDIAEEEMKFPDEMTELEIQSEFDDWVEDKLIDLRFAAEYEIV